MPSEWRQIDRIEIDETRRTITFAIAGTLGTANEKAWTYSNKKDAFSHDRTVLERIDDTIRIAALRLGSPAAIWIEPSIVRIVALNKFGVETASFACHK